MRLKQAKAAQNNAIPGAYLSDKTNVTNVKYSRHATLGPELVTSGARRVRIDEGLVLKFSACAWEMIWDKRSGSGGKS